MKETAHPPGRDRRPHRLAVAIGFAITSGAAAILLAFAPAVPADAHGDDEAVPAFDLVRQAIALIVNTPHDTDAIADRIGDAIESEDTEGVQLSLVEQAEDSLAAADLHTTRTLLEQSIGARVHTGDTDPVVIGDVPPAATGAETGTIAAIDALPGRGSLNGGDWSLLILSLAVAVAGVAFSFLRRPHPSPPQTTGAQP